MRILLKPLSAILLLISFSALADPQPFYELGPHPDQTSTSIGLLLLNLPEYDGAAIQKTSVLPNVTYVNQNGFFIDDTSGMGVNFSSDQVWEYGARLTADLGRPEPEDLHGLGKIPPHINGGIFVNLNLSETFGFESAVTYGSGYNRDGLRTDIGTSYAFYSKGLSRVEIDASVGYANQHYAQSYYGVSPNQSISSGYPVFHPRDGMDVERLGISASAPIGEKWLGFASLGGMRLIGNAAEGPYIHKPTAAIIFFGLSYQL